MESVTVGTFLREKMGNMARWVEQGIGKENLPADIVALVATLGSVEVTYLATILNENHASIVHRDWTFVSKLLESEPRVPRELVQVMLTLRNREEMHDKFWRYLSLFSNAVSN